MNCDTPGRNSADARKPSPRIPLLTNSLTSVAAVNSENNRTCIINRLLLLQSVTFCAKTIGLSHDRAPPAARTCRVSFVNCWLANNEPDNVISRPWPYTGM